MTRTNVANGDMKTPNIHEVVETNCNTEYCFFAIYEKNGIKYYQFFSDLQNSCTTYPTCLLFESEEYKYSITYQKTDRQCNSGVNYTINYELPTCDSGWNSFVRSNGKTWCYKIITTIQNTYDEAVAVCKNVESTLNGFAHWEEFEEFKNVVKENGISNSIVLGAQQYPVIPKPCSPTFRWLPEVSNNTELVNNSTIIDYNCSGECLQYKPDLGKFDDFNCTKPGDRFSACGKWAV
ncbi:unnamed protein product [Caenorhabditis angaria]|uniref:C-type lectin domain-containing protein n=1 Tax=Caenorhabditis angaria TaxID=860376 RepID=A0A9P1IXA9_9PELO|nr:unnamed protein product [Caenorhabditis angaria]